VLARELGVDYASVCVVVNHAAGRGDSVAIVSMEAIANVLETAMDRVRALLEHVVPRVPLAPRDTAAAPRAAVIMGASGDGP
jgi:purine nucleoside phosphorylase